MARRRDRLARIETAVMRANNNIRARVPSHPKVDVGIGHTEGANRLRGRRGSRARARSRRVTEAIVREGQAIRTKYGSLIDSQPAGGDSTNSP